jgi:hypothetical protein
MPNIFFFFFHNLQNIFKMKKIKLILFFFFFFYFSAAKIFVLGGLVFTLGFFGAKEEQSKERKN